MRKRFEETAQPLFSRSSAVARYFISSRFVRFCIVGSTGVIVDTALTVTFATGFGFPIAASKAIGAEVAICNNFYWNDRWTFRKTAYSPGKLRRFLFFNAICLWGLLVNVLIVVSLVTAGIPLIISSLISTLSIAVLNFALCRRFGWREPAC